MDPVGYDIRLPAGVVSLFLAYQRFNGNVSRIKGRKAQSEAQLQHFPEYRMIPPFISRCNKYTGK